MVNLTVPVQSFGQFLTLLSSNDFLQEEGDLAQVVNDGDKNKIKC